MNHYEFLFEAEMTSIAPLFNCLYIKIPDAKKTRESIKKGANGRTYMDEYKRPFDAILVTPSCNICIEAKANYNKLEPHQRKYGEKISSANGLFSVLRVIVNEKTFKKRYNIESVYGDIILETERIEDIFKYFVQK